MLHISDNELNCCVEAIVALAIVEITFKPVILFKQECSPLVTWEFIDSFLGMLYNLIVSVLYQEARSFQLWNSTRTLQPKSEEPGVMQEIRSCYCIPARSREQRARGSASRWTSGLQCDDIDTRQCLCSPLPLLPHLLVSRPFFLPPALPRQHSSLHHSLLFYLLSCLVVTLCLISSVCLLTLGEPISSLEQGPLHSQGPWRKACTGNTLLLHHTRQFSNDILVRYNLILKNLPW